MTDHFEHVERRVEAQDAAAEAREAVIVAREAVAATTYSLDRIAARLRFHFRLGLFAVAAAVVAAGVVMYLTSQSRNGLSEALANQEVSISNQRTLLANQRSLLNLQSFLVNCLTPGPKPPHEDRTGTGNECYDALEGNRAAAVRRIIDQNHNGIPDATEILDKLRAR